MNGTRFTTDQVRWRRPGRSPARGGASRALAPLIGVALVLLAVAVAGVLIASGASNDAPAVVDTAGPAGSAGAGQAAASEAEPAADSGSGLVELPSGSETVGGHPLGFPRDELGAVAVPVELNRSQVGFDYAAAADVARLYAASGDKDAVEARARAAVASRRRELGVAPTGPVTAPASFALSPYAYDITPLNPTPDEDPDTGVSTGAGDLGGDRAGRYVVSVLSLASLTDSVGRVSQRYYAGTQLVVWSDEWDDWKVLEPTRTDLARLRELDQDEAMPAASIAPGEVRALREAGWIPIATAVNEQGTSR